MSTRIDSSMSLFRAKFFSRWHSDGVTSWPLPTITVPSTVATSGTVLNLTTNNWYEAKVVIGNDVMSPTNQRLRFWVDTLDTLPPRQGQADGDGDYSDETTLLDTNAVDYTWPLTQRVPRRGTDRNAITELRSDR